MAPSKFTHLTHLTDLANKAMPELGKLLVVAGVILALVGLLVWSGFGKSWFGHLPGDIHYTSKNFRFYFPIVTCLLLSLLLSLILWLVRKQ
jgi:Protein of unknown function (DUF2905)